MQKLRKSTSNKVRARVKRKRRIRGKISGVADCPRLSVFRTAKHVYAQIIDDDAGATLFGLSSKKMSSKRANVDVCKEMGLKFAEGCKGKKIEKLSFDRNGFIYHGRLKAFADGVREGGIKF